MRQTLRQNDLDLDLDDLLAGTEDAALRRLLLDWDARRGVRAMPTPEAMVSVDLRAVEGDLIEIDVEAAAIALSSPAGRHLRFFYRRVGANLAARFGAGLIGRCVDELATVSSYFAHVQASLEAAAARRAPRVERHQLMTDSGEMYAYEALQLPLSRDGRTIDRFLVCCRVRPQILPVLPS